MGFGAILVLILTSGRSGAQLFIVHDSPETQVFRHQRCRWNSNGITFI